MWKGLVTGAIVVTAFGAGVGWSTAQQGPTLTAEDRAEIQQLHARYAQGTDFRQGDMWLSVFTDDAVFQPGTHAAEVIGMEALTEWRRQNFAARPADRQNRHWNSGWVITPTPDPFNQALVAIPMYLLYEVGILLSRITGAAARRRAREQS